MPATRGRCAKGQQGRRMWGQVRLYPLQSKGWPDGPQGQQAQRRRGMAHWGSACHRRGRGAGGRTQWRRRRQAGGRAPGAGGGAAAAATAAAIETVAVETVTYQRGPTRSSRHRRRGSRCPNSRPELQVTDATAPGSARPESAGGGGDPDRGSRGGQRSPCRSPQTSEMARPRDLPPHPESRSRS